MSSRPPTFLRTLYRWTIRLAPASHQREYADEQMRLFDDVWQEALSTGRAVRVRRGSVLVARGIVAAIGVRVDQRRRRRAALGSRPSGGSHMGVDLRFTLRQLKAAPWYAMTIVGVMAVTMALATTTFAIVDGVLFRPLPYREADRLVTVQPGFSNVAGTAAESASTSHVDLANWHAAAPDVPFTGFRAQRAAETGPGVGLRDDTSGIAEVQANFFDVIGVRPLFGGFSDRDFAEQAHYRPVIVMYDTWQTRFAGDPGVIGRVEMLIRPRDYGLRVVGVMPRGFTFPSARVEVDFLAPLVPATPDALSNPRSRAISEVVARLPAGMRPDQLTSRLARGLSATAAHYNSLGGPRRGFDPSTERPYDMVTVTPLSRSLARRSGDLFLAVVAAAALLILLAAANVSSLMAARALERRRELDVRRSLGATRGAIVRLWMTESLGLLFLGAAVGAFMALPLLSLMTSMMPESIVLLKAPRLDWRVAGFVTLVSLFVSVLVALAPIRWSLRLPVGGSPKGGSSERLQTPGRFAVVAGQVAAALVLAVVGTSLVLSLLTVYDNDRPIRTEGVVVLESRLHGPGGRRTPNDVQERVARGSVVSERFGQLPGVTAVGLAEAEVLRGGSGGNLFSRPDGIARLPGLDTWAVTGAFYRAIEPVVTAGRLPTEDELEAGEPVVVVSERVAEGYWPGQNAVGQTVTHLASKLPHTVVGVVRDVPWHGWDLESPMIYGPYSRLTNSSFQTFFIRTERGAAETIREAISAVVETDPTMRPRTAATLEEMYLVSVNQRRFLSWLFGGFATAAVLVVAIGILGLLAMSAARRTKEVGIRCALGATPGSVAILMVREQFRAVTAGLVAGAIVAAWAVGLVEGFLYQLTPADLRIWATAVALILLMAAVGTLIPAIRASRTDPLVALRTE